VTSRIEMAFGTVVPLATVGMLAAGYGLAEIILLRVVASLINCAILWASIRRLLPGMKLVWPDRNLATGLVEFSAFSFLSRIAALTYTYADKLIIGAVVGLKELAYYTVAATLANRVLGLTFRLSSVLFPSASAMSANGEGERLKALYIKASRYVVFINGSVLIFIGVFAYPILYYWMNPEFARYGALVLTIVAIAQFVDSLTNIPSLINDGLGHPRVSGSFALARACIGLVAVYGFVQLWGIEGAAWAHLMAATLMTTFFLLFVHGRTVPCALPELLRHSYALPMTLVLVVAGLSGVLAHFAENRFWWLAVVMIFPAILLPGLGVRLVLRPDDRAKLRSRFNMFMSEKV
jgi:O-antigen/teichoic acid export membrane protein